MNPSSGFLQAVTGLVSGLGDKTGNIGKGNHGLPVSGDTMSAADDNTRSFLAWVQNYMKNAAGADADGAGVFNLQPGDLDSDLPVLDQLQALMADAMDQFPADRRASHSSNGHPLDNGNVSLSQGIINAIITPQERYDSADEPAHAVVTTNIKGMVAWDNTPADEPTHAAGADPLVQTAASGIPIPAGQADERQIKENTPSIGQPKPAAPGIPSQAGQADERSPIKSPPNQVMKDNRPAEGFEKGDASSLSKSVPAGDDGQTGTNRLIQERLPAGQGIAERSTNPAFPPSQPAGDQANEPESRVTGITEKRSASSEDDAADFRGKDRHHPAQRLEVTEVKEADWQKGQSSDSIKSAVFEQSRSQPSFQDAAKAMAGEPTTNTAVKAVTGQAAAMTRTEDAAVKSFQTTVMDQIVERAAIRSIHGRSEVQIRLKPEFLGNVQMNIAADKEQLVVRIMTDQPVVKEIIETHLHHLKTELHNQGLTIERFEVMVNPDADQQNNRDQFAQMFKHNNSQNGRRQPRGQDPETVNHDGGNNPDEGQPNRDGVNYFA
jgi:hypothetical protein